MSEEEDFEDTGDEGDFSASEDEWKPSKNMANNSSDFETESEEIENVSMGKNKRPGKRRKANISSRSLKVRKIVLRNSLRSRMYKKYQPPPKTFSSPRTRTRDSESDDNTKHGLEKKIVSNNDDGSESSCDEHLFNPDEIDLDAIVQNMQTKTEPPSTEEKPPIFDCNAGMRLSESEEEGDLELNNVEEKPLADNSGRKQLSNQDIISKLNKESSEKINLSHLENYTKNLETAKEQLKNFKSDAFKSEKPLDISTLLAMGESAADANPKAEKKAKKIKKELNESESDWEEVKDELGKEYDINDLQIIVQHPSHMANKKKDPDLEAALKRKVNRIIRERQVSLHKVTLLSHIGTAMYSNRILNSAFLMECALRLLPNKKCYPDGRTDIKYFEQISRWFKQTIKLENEQMYTNVRPRPRLDISLAFQFRNKIASCKRDFVFMFIILLRAMGMQCRLITNIVPLPIRPPQSELLTIKLKEKEEENQKQCSDKSQNSKSDKPSQKLSEKVDRNKNAKSIDMKIKKEPEKPKILTEKVKKVEKNHQNKEIEKESALTAPSIIKGTVQITENNIFSPRKTRNQRNQHDSKDNNYSANNLKVQKLNKSDKLPETITSTNISTKTDNNLEFTKPKKSTNTKSENKHDSKLSTHANKKVSSEKIVVSTHFLKKDKNKGQKVVNSTEVPENTVISAHFSKSNTKSFSKTIANETKTEKSRIKKTNLKVDNLSIPQLDGSNDLESNKTRPKRVTSEKASSSKATTSKHTKNSELMESELDSGDDFVPSPPKKLKKSKRDKRVLSTDADEDNDKTSGKDRMDYWVEVYSEAEEQWVSMDLFRLKVHCVDLLRKSATQPIAYVFAWNNDNTLKDVSTRYCAQWHTTTRKYRIEPEWLEKAIAKYRGEKTARDKAEDIELEKIHLDKPLPQTITEYKNHPLYALERHLLKFEAIYPRNALTLGYVRNEPVYARECVHTLHSREIWLKSAKVVKMGEEPYKIVKARPKWDKYSNSVIKDQPLEIFGFWQTEDYVPPTAEDGIVPRNAYGNVELFKKCMLPKKTVHLQLPGLNRICKKLQVDCAPAVVGFDFHQGSCHPVFDGFVVCEEYEDFVIQAWYKDLEDSEKREEEKYLQRVYGNWKKLIRGLLIRQKLQKKYNLTLEKPM